MSRQTLPEEYAWVRAGKDALIFLLEDLQSGSARLAVRDRTAEPSRPVEPSPGRNFAGAFREAFERLDRRNGLSNFVKLVDLRRDLADFERERFDAELRQLRVDGEFSLSRHEGQHELLSPEEREAGITEMDSLFVYVYRR